MAPLRTAAGLTTSNNDKNARMLQKKLSVSRCNKKTVALRGLIIISIVNMIFLFATTAETRLSVENHASHLMNEFTTQRETATIPKNDTNRRKTTQRQTATTPKNERKMVSKITRKGLGEFNTEPSDKTERLTINEARLDNGWQNLTQYNSSNEVFNVYDLRDKTKLRPGRRLPLYPAVPLLGVLVDGGRHYFPLDWLKRCVDQLHLLRYNFIHLRLSDDQVFNMKLDSHPELAAPAPPIKGEDEQKENPVWSKEELRELVKYAEDRGIAIMPEINLPGHTGSFGGLPGMVIPCPAFSCSKGYGIPLNITNPKLMTVIENIIREIRDVFTSSPYLHLGGDEVHMSKPCFQEIGITMFDYNVFETDLKNVLRKLNISESHVVRWEMTGQKGVDERAGEVQQWWLQSAPYNMQGKPFFVSQGLYLDSCGDRTGPEFYNHVVRQVDEDPTAIIVGTFELSTHWWEDRNVLGRMLAVAMGASREARNKGGIQWSQRSYMYYCKTLGWDDSVCTANGKNLFPQHKYIQKWNKHWQTWKDTTCNRLTEQVEVRNVKKRFTTEQGVSRGQFEIMTSVDWYWKVHGTVSKYNQLKESELSENRPPLFSHQVNHTGVTLDLVRYQNYNFDITFDLLAELGLNLVHLRLVDDSGFIIQLESHPNLALDLNNLNGNRKKVFSAEMMAEIVKKGDKRGIKIMPEINVVSKAGGWLASGLVVKCPKTMCDKRLGIPLNFPDMGGLLSVVSNVIYELRGIFSSSYIHLGYNDWEETKSCFDEAGIKPNHQDFEKKLFGMMRAQGIDSKDILRWESSDVARKDRVGDITHYQSTMPPDNAASTTSFFLSSNLGYGDGSNDADAWTIYQHTRKLLVSEPKGILGKYLAINPDEWIKHNAIGKLIAMAIGVSDLPQLDSEKFRETYMKACGKVQGGDCELFGSAKDGNKLKDSHDQVAEGICDIYTESKLMLVSRPDILASD